MFGCEICNVQKVKCDVVIKCIREVISVRDDKVCRSAQLTIAALVPMVRGLVPGTHHVQARLWLNHGRTMVASRPDTRVTAEMTNER